VTEDRSHKPNLFDRMLARRWWALLAVLALTAGLGVFAGRVKPDFRVEMLFPDHDQRRVDYERYKKAFPLEDARALVIVEAPDLFTPAGLARIAALETELAKLPGVSDTEGLTTVNDVVGDDIELRPDKLFPRPDLPPDQLAKQRAIATGDPLFKWTLATPDGKATSIRVTLKPAAAKLEVERSRFLHDARKLLARHARIARDAGVQQRLVLNGLPVIRSEFNELISMDMALLVPVALLVILILLGITFRRVAEVAAALVTIIFAVIWTVGAMGVMGIPLQLLTQITSIVVMIVSISDTVHIISTYKERVAAGDSVPRAIAAACHDSAIPCLLTEVTIAGGFLALLSADMQMIQQFGLATAAGMILVWLANVTVLPLALSFMKPDRAATAQKDAIESASARTFKRFVAWIEHTVKTRPRTILGVTGVLVVTAAVVGTLGYGAEYYSYDDLRPGSKLAQNLRYVEQMHGGTVPMAVFIEPVKPGADAMHEPEALALIDSIEQRLEADFPDVKNAGSMASFMRKAHRLFAGEDEAAKSPLPGTRPLIAQELIGVDDSRNLRDFLSSDHGTAAVFAMLPDHGSTQATKVIARMEAGFRADMVAHPNYRVTLTGIYGIADGIYRSLVGGLLRSLAIAILVSFIIFCFVLRSWRLALIALVPNLLPLILTFGMMGALDIDIKPSTVFLFSITLVIADDDTIQYLSRFRRRFLELRAAGHPDPHEGAAFDTLRESGLPMFVTSLAVTLGFLTLLLSRFVGLANLGLLIGISLLTAVFADLFLSPLLLIKLRPKI